MDIYKNKYLKYKKKYLQLKNQIGGAIEIIDSNKKVKSDNKLLDISTEQTNTFLGFEENKEEKRRDRVLQALQRRNQTLGKSNKTNN